MALHRLFAVVWIGVLIAGAAPALGQSADVVPAPLYFIRNNDQVWRMEADGQTQAQITHEDRPVTGFDVSPTDGALVYISNNDLIRADAFGKERTVLVDGVELVEADGTGAGYVEQLIGQIRSPRWSPDGEQIAFAMGGINVIAAQGGASQLLLPNIVSETEGDPMIAFSGSASYLPEVWSPDGARLLVQVLLPPEQGGFAVLNPVDGALIPITNEEYGEMTCCYPSWSSDSTSIYYSIGNHFFTPSLWRADVQTGESETLVEGVDEAGTYTLVAHPRQLSDGRLYSFTTITDSPDPNNIMPLAMYRSDPDGSSLEPLREESYLIGGVLWAADGSGAVIEDVTNFEATETASLLWLPADGSAPVQLEISGRELRWGLR